MMRRKVGNVVTGVFEKRSTAIREIISSVGTGNVGN
jgi:hypothetical protein